MIVFHGSIAEIKSPKVSCSKKFLDFGLGIYLTSYQKQAEKWAARKADRIDCGTAIVNIFELNENWYKLNVLNFESETEQWLDFVCRCRKGSDEFLKYDLIIGPVADDDVFKTINMYFRGLWDKQKTLDEIRYYKTSNQICITKQQIADELLVFKSSYEVK